MVRNEMRLEVLCIQRTLISEGAAIAFRQLKFNTKFNSIT